MKHLNNVVNRQTIDSVAEKAHCQIKAIHIIRDYFDNFRSCNATTVNSVSYLSSAFLSNNSLYGLKGLVITDLDEDCLKLTLSESVSYIIVDEPKYFFAALFHEISGPSKQKFLETYSPKTHPNVHESAHISKGAMIGRGATIGRDCVILEGVSIHDSVTLGENVFVKQNSVLGGIGFGFAVSKGKPPLRMPHLGGVVIADNVEIGSSVNIDRGTFGDTEVGAHVKIDNSVHIAHNVTIGARTLIIANSEISGSVQIGEDVWIAPNVSIREKISIGDRALIGLGSVVIKNVDPDSTVIGVPARPLV